MQFFPVKSLKQAEVVQPFFPANYKSRGERGFFCEDLQ